VINSKAMQNNYLHHRSTTNTVAVDDSPDCFHHDDELVFLSTTTKDNDVDKVEEKEHDDQKHIEIDKNKQKNNRFTNNHDHNSNDKSFQSIVMPDESSTFSYYEEYQYPEQQQHTHANSHDSLLQTDHEMLMPIHTTGASSSSTDDLSLVTPNLSLSAFHSKDSALGLSDDNLNCVRSNPLNTIPTDDDEQQISSSSLAMPTSQSKYHSDKCCLRLLSFFNFLFVFLFHLLSVSLSTTSTDSY
jgi:hypothetical protein